MAEIDLMKIPLARALVGFVFITLTILVPIVIYYIFNPSTFFTTDIFKIILICGSSGCCLMSLSLCLNFLAFGRKVVSKSKLTTITLSSVACSILGYLLGFFYIIEKNIINFTSQFNYAIGSIFTTVAAVGILLRILNIFARYGKYKRLKAERKAQ